MVEEAPFPDPVGNAERFAGHKLPEKGTIFQKAKTGQQGIESLFTGDMAKIFTEGKVQTNKDGGNFQEMTHGDNGDLIPTRQDQKDLQESQTCQGD